MATDCIEWQKYRDKKGYGTVKRDGKQRRAHRVAYCDHHDLPIEGIDGQCVLHTCDNPPCVNPDHLRLGTHQDNSDDKMSKGRGDWSRPACGESHGNSKLTIGQVLAIRDDERSQRVIAREYGMCHQTIGEVKRREIWGHVK